MVDSNSDHESETGDDEEGGGGNQQQENRPGDQGGIEYFSNNFTILTPTHLRTLLTVPIFQVVAVAMRRKGMTEMRAQ